MFRGWRGPMDLEPGLVKWLHLAGGYGHLRYWFLEWQPTPAAPCESTSNGPTRLRRESDRERATGVEPATSSLGR
jgi:hypothetical protein